MMIHVAWQLMLSLDSKYLDGYGSKRKPYTAVFVHFAFCSLPFFDPQPNTFRPRPCEANVDLTNGT